MGSTALYGFPWPELTDNADGPGALEALALAVEANYNDTSSIQYTPELSSVGTGAVQPSTPANRRGVYRVNNGWCDVAIYFGFSPSVDGGRMELRVSLPVAPSAALSCFLEGLIWIPSSGFYHSHLLCGSGLVGVPEVATNTGVFIEGQWRNANSTGSAGTGVPGIAGAYTIQPGGWAGWTGRYPV